MHGRGPSIINCNTIVNLARFHNQSLIYHIEIGLLTMMKRSLTPAWEYCVCRAECGFVMFFLSRCVLLSLAR